MSVIVEVTCAALFAIALVMMITAYESNQWSQSDGGTVFTQANMKVYILHDYTALLALTARFWQTIKIF